MAKYFNSVLVGFSLLVMNAIDAQGGHGGGGGGHGGGGHGGGGWHHGAHYGGGFYRGGVFVYGGGFYSGYWGYGYGPGYWGYGYYSPTYVVTAPQVVYQPWPSDSAYAPAPTPIPKEPLPPPIQKTPLPGPAATEELNAAPLLAVTNTVPVSNQASPQVDSLVRQLTQPDEAARSEAAIQLGRMKARSAVTTLSSVLAKDASPAVRDSAARALGLIASPESLDALTLAAQADDDREVRRSSQFAVDVIRWNLREK